MRSLTQILKQESPISLAREVVWRTQKDRNKKRLLRQIDSGICPVTFRNVPYYAPDLFLFDQPSREIVTAFADEICEGRYPFLGHGTANLGVRPKWNLDFVSGLEWPHSRLEHRDCMRWDGSDIKAPWELSRLQFLPILGKAHVLTGKEHYRVTAKELISFWIEQNSMPIGVNWSIAMEAALRAMSICFLVNLLSPIRQQEDKWLASVTRSLWQHLVYIEAHIEFSHLISSNHYLSNIVGLYCLSCFLNGDGMDEKRLLYRHHIEAEMLRQVYEDGGDYEGSLGYHVLVTQMFTSALLLMRAESVIPGSQFVGRLSRMYRYMNQIASPSGQLPHFGDCDDGRVELITDDLQQMLRIPVPHRNSLRVSNLLSIGKCLFPSGTGAVADAKWYGSTTNGHASSTAVIPKKRVSRDMHIFPQSGVAVARMGRAELIFFAVRNGIYGKGSHSHNDKLSVVLRLDGEEVLCDSGTGTYTRDPDLRNRFRMTAAHNTVIVDDREQNTIDPGRPGVFRIGTEAEVSSIEDGQENGVSFLRASHTGYRSLGVTHIRTIHFAESGESLILDDLLEGSGRHAFALNFQLAPDWQVASLVQEDSHIRCRVAGRGELEITFRAPGSVRAETQESLISMTYGSTTPSSRLRLCGEAPFPTRLITKLHWAI